MPESTSPPSTPSTPVPPPPTPSRPCRACGVTRHTCGEYHHLQDCSSLLPKVKCPACRKSFKGATIVNPCKRNLCALKMCKKCAAAHRHPCGQCGEKDGDKKLYRVAPPDEVGAVYCGECATSGLKAGTLADPDNEEDEAEADELTKAIEKAHA
jgi:hypothetical protein